MKVLTEDGIEANEGVIYLRGTLIFKGYYNNTAATEQCMTSEGWFNTGDIARIDANGDFHLPGRQEEILLLHGNTTPLFSTWDEKKQSEAVVVLFNPSEDATGPKKLRFTANGEQVAFCGGLDDPPDIRRALGHVRYRSVLSDLVPALTGMSPEEAKAFVDETSKMEDPEFYEAIHRKLPPAVLQENGGLTVQRIKAYGKVEGCHRRMAWDSRPQGKVPVVDIFAPDALPLFDISGFESWRAVLDQWQNHSDKTRVHPIPGNHYTVLKQPDIVEFQKSLNAALEARGL